MRWTENPEMMVQFHPRGQEQNLQLVMDLIFVNKRKDSLFLHPETSRSTMVVHSADIRETVVRFHPRGQVDRINVIVRHLANPSFDLRIKINDLRF